MKRSKFIIICMCMLFMVLAFNSKKVKAADAKFTDNKDGTVKFEYNNTQTSKVKIVVQIKDGKQYKYDVPKGECEFNIPLSQGNGDYKIYLCKNSSGSKYSVLQTQSIKLDLKDGKEAFLTSTCIIDWDETNKAIKKAQELTKDSKKDADKLQAIYDYIVKNYSYDYDKANNVEELSVDAAYVPDIEVVFKDEKGICYDISVLFASMLRSVEIPAKVVTGYTPNANTYHAWNNVFYTPKKDWKVIDATYDLQMYKAKKKYTMFKDEADYDQVVYTY